jgi:spermidine/putrescine-binding protein
MISRRTLLTGLGSGLLVSTLAACAPSRGGSSAPRSSGTVGGTIRMANYEDWMGADQVSGFEKAFPGASVKQGTLPDGAWVEYLRQNEGAFDFALGGGASVFQLNASDLLHRISVDDVPNLANIPQVYRDAVPGAMPLEQGKFGIAYSKTRVSDPPTSWAELFERARSGRAGWSCRRTTGRPSDRRCWRSGSTRTPRTRPPTTAAGISSSGSSRM